MGKEKHAGRPLKFKTVKELQVKIEAYFVMCEEKKKPLTLSGLALALDVDRKTILNYSNKEEYFPTVKKARAMCENYAEERLFSGGQVAGIIFNLKNNYSWEDKTHQELSGEVKMMDRVKIDGKDLNIDVGD